MSIRVEYPGFWTKKLIKSKQFMLLFKEAKAHRILLELGKLLVVDAYKKELQLLQKPNDHNSQYLFRPIYAAQPSQSTQRSLKGFLFHFSRRSIHFYRLSHSELDDIEKVAVRSSLRLPKTKNALLSLEP
ncbi:hypothetical protein Tco_0496216 [Tanacetum coccineum]